MQEWQSVRRREKTFLCETLPHRPRLASELWVMDPEWDGTHCSFPLPTAASSSGFDAVCSGPCDVCHSTYYSKKYDICGKETQFWFAMLQPPRKYTKIAKKAVHRKKNLNRYFLVHSSGFCLKWGFHGGKHSIWELDILRHRSEDTHGSSLLSQFPCQFQAPSLVCSFSACHMG